MIEEALDAWKKGDALRTLARRKPPMRFADPDFAAGMKLEGYQIDPEGKATDYVIDFPVKLMLKDRRGRPVTRDAIFQVSQLPGDAVLRNDP